MANEPACLNWLRSCGPFVQTNIEEVLEGAFEIGSQRIRPNLVTHVDYTSKPPFTLTYHIRPEARWSDGAAVSARDFVFAHRAIRRYVPPNTENPDLRYHRATVRSVRGLGPKTVRVVLNARSANWKALFGFVLPSHVLAGADLEKIWSDRIDNPRTGEPIGSGPFLVEDWDRGKRLVLRRNPNYWGPHPAYLDRIVQRFGIGDLAEALRSGGVDYLPMLRPSESAFFLNSSPSYEQNWSGYRYKPTLARNLLEQAGCRPGSDGIHVCDGQRLSLRFVTPAGAGAARRRVVLELAQRQLRRVGVDVDAAYLPGGVLFSQIIVPGRFDVALFTWFYPPEGVPSDVFACGRFQNYTGYCQRLVTRDLDQAERILAPSRRAHVLNRADRQMAKDVPVLPLWTEPAAATVREEIRGFVPSFPLLAWNAENWWLDD